MTSFEHFFRKLSEIVDFEGYPWPKFLRESPEDFTWVTLDGIGDSLILNCGTCDGPSDPRHPICRECIKKRMSTARKAYEKEYGKPIKKWRIVMLARVYDASHL